MCFIISTKKTISLKRKIVLISIQNALVLLIFFQIVMTFITRENRQLLWKATADSLSISFTMLHDRMENIQSASKVIALDKSVQQKLEVLNDNPEDFTYQMDTDLYYIIEAYHQQFKDNEISYIILAHEELKRKPYIHTYIGKEWEFPEEVFEHLVQTAKESEQGYEWVTEYSDQYGLFFVRDIKRVSWAKLDSLGTLIIQVDIKKILNNMSDVYQQYKRASYAVRFLNQLIISGQDQAAAEDIKTLLESEKPYQVVKINNKRFFAMKSNNFYSGWDFLSLIPYDSVYHADFAAKVFAFLTILLGIIMTIIYSERISKTITAPLDNLVEKIKRFGESNAVMEDLKGEDDYTARDDEFGILHKNFDQMSKRIHRLIYVNYKKEILVKEAQLKSLERQVNPHFLYNTLQVISWKAKSVHAEEVAQMVEALGFLLRGTLSGEDSEITIQTELEFVEKYLTIQQQRFGSQLCVSMDIDETLLEFKIPKLIIQPLVENAIHYALEECVEVCCVKIKVGQKNQHLFIEVKNNGSSFEPDLLMKLKQHKRNPNGFGIGLLNIEQRIKLMFGENYGIELFNDGDWAVARIILPNQPVS